MQKKCVTILDFACWPETMVDNRNELSKPIATDILEKLNNEQRIIPEHKPFGDGPSVKRILQAIERFE